VVKIIYQIRAQYFHVSRVIFLISLSLACPEVTRLAECLDWLNHGFDINYNEFEIDKILEKYQHADEKYYQHFLQERGYFLENYLISHLFHSDFLFASQ